MGLRLASVDDREGSYLYIKLIKYSKGTTMDQGRLDDLLIICTSYA
jgi:hypothetical protein